MKNIYEAELNDSKVWFVREENNTIGQVFLYKKDAYDFFKGKKISPLGVSVNSEVLTLGKSIGFLKDIKQID
jgi:hypothetical protein